MFFALLVLGGLLAALGGLIFIVDCFKVHVLWGLSAIFLPFISLICLFKHWSETKRGFLLYLLAIPFLAGAFFTMPKANAKTAPGQSATNNDPFYNAMQRARDAVAKVQDSRKEVVPTKAPISSPPTPPPALAIVNSAPTETVTQRLARNRAVFKELETHYAALNNKKKALPKGDSKAIAAFNIEAKSYADKLAEVRAEQSILLELQATSTRAK